MLQGWLTAVPFQQDHREYFKLKIIQSTVVVSSAMVPVAQRQERSQRLLLSVVIAVSAPVQPLLSELHLLLFS
jgi:hypothetical protein